MKLFFCTLFFFANFAQGASQTSLSYQVSTKRFDKSQIQDKKETIFILANNQTWIEVKKDRYYVSYQTGAFYFFDLTTGTRHQITQKESQITFKQSNALAGCKMNYQLVETTSIFKEKYDICLVESKSAALPLEVYLWLMNPALSMVSGLDQSIMALTPQSITSINKSGDEIKRVLLPNDNSSLFKDDTDELWKLPLGKPCANRYCGQLI